MKAKALQAEIEQSLLAGLELRLSACIGKTWRGEPVKRVLDEDEIRALMRERAANLAQALASRTLSEETADAIYDADARVSSAQMIERIMRDLNGE